MDTIVLSKSRMDELYDERINAEKVWLINAEKVWLIGSHEDKLFNYGEEIPNRGKCSTRLIFTSENNDKTMVFISMNYSNTEIETKMNKKDFYMCVYNTLTDKGYKIKEII